MQTTRTSFRRTLGLGAVTAIALTATVGGAALASRGADDPASSSTSVSSPTASPTASVDDNGGRVSRDQRTEAGDDRRVNGTASPSTTATDDHGRHHEAGDDHGRRHGGHGADDSTKKATKTVKVTVAKRSSDDSARHSAQHDAGDDHGRLGGHGADDPAGHDAGDDHGRHGGHGSDD